MDETRVKEKSEIIEGLNLSSNDKNVKMILSPASEKKPTISLLLKSKGTSISMLFLALGSWLFGQLIVAVILLGGAVILFFIFALNSKAQALTGATSNSELNQESSLRNLLFQTQYLENIDNHGESLYKQFEELNEKYSAYLKLLSSKFSPNEITFQRYYAAVESIYLALLENFKKMANSYKFLSLIAIKELKTQLHKASTDEAKNLLSNKIDTYDQQLQNTLELYKLNQSALTEMDKLSFAINEIKNSQAVSETDLQMMMKQLQELAARAEKYNKLL